MPQRLCRGGESAWRYTVLADSQLCNLARRACGSKKLCMLLCGWVGLRYTSIVVRAFVLLHG